MTQLFVDGVWVKGDGRELRSTDPASGAPVWAGHEASKTQVDAAVMAARRAFENVKDVSLDERIGLVQRFARLVEEHRNELARVISLETGKPAWESITEVVSMVSKVDITIRAYRERTGTVERDLGAFRSVVRHRPHGVLAVLGPYNFPGHLPNAHIVPALLAGNTVVFKPSEYTPWCAVEALRLWEQAGLPQGALNLIQGGKSTGAALVEHPQIDGLLFTGSAVAGQAIHHQFAGHPERILALEMGGNNPVVVDGTADVDAAVYTILQSAFLTAGQRCTCARRLFVPRGSFGQALIDRLLDAMGKLRVGSYDDPDPPFMGPVISEHAANDLLSAQATLVSLGGKPLAPMCKLKEGTGLVSPALVDVTSVRSLPDEEYFGPLLQLIYYNDFEEALQSANATRFGLAAGLIGGDHTRWGTFLRHIRAGVINWNRPPNGAALLAPVRRKWQSPSERLLRGGLLRLPHGVSRAGGAHPARNATPGNDALKSQEVNFDGLVGPTHNYSGLAAGNVASERSAHAVSNPRAAAKQGLRKMKLLHDLGVPQGVLPPQERPAVDVLRRLGFVGRDQYVLHNAQRHDPELLAACCSASSMWAANAATVCPSSDSADGKVHFTPANLRSNFHRAIEAPTTARVLEAIFGDPMRFVHHHPLPKVALFGDEGAANHTRLCASYGDLGVHLFVYGKRALDRSVSAPERYPARQTLEASQAIARLHHLDAARVLFAQQSPAAIDAGVFHNDVIAVGNLRLFMFHEHAFVHQDALKRELEVKVGEGLRLIEVAATDITLEESVSTYFFNSQLVTLPTGKMALVVPEECKDTTRVWAYLQGLAGKHPEIERIESIDVRQSMRNGGGPACLRLRVVLTDDELQSINRRTLLDDGLFVRLNTWIDQHYRDRLDTADLGDPLLLEESRTALDELSQLLALGSVYPFQL